MSCIHLEALSVWLFSESHRNAVRVPVALFLSTFGLHPQATKAAQEPIVIENHAGWAEGIIEGPFPADPDGQQTLLITADHTFPRGLRVLEPEAKQMFRSLNFKGANASGVPELRTLTLQGPLSVDFGQEGGITAYFDDRITLDFAGRPAVLDTVTQDSHLELRGAIENAAGLVKKGKGARVYLGGRNLGVTGLVRVEGGWLMLRDEAALPGITGITLTGIRDDPTVFAMEGDGPHDRVPDAAPITVSGGASIVISGSSERPLNETLGRVSVRDSALQLEVKGKKASTPVTLTVSELVRDASSLLVVGGEKFGEAGFVKIQRDAAILSALKGGGGMAGSTAISVVPWARGFGGGRINDAWGFLTYVRDLGFRELRPEEYAQGLQASVRPTDNVRITTTEPMLTQAKTVNSLLCSLPRGLRHRVVDLGNKTLSIVSGALSAESPTTILGGALTTGNDRPLFFVGNFNLNTRLAGKGGAVFYAGEMTRLTNPHNSLTGDWTFAGGRVLVTDDEIIPDSVTLRLHRGVELWMEGSESVTAIAGNGALKPAVGGRSALMLGLCVAQANQAVMGSGGAIYPGDQSRTPEIGTLRLWATNSDERIGFLKIEDGILAIDVATDGNDSVVLQSENKAAVVSGGTLRVNRLGGFVPKVGSSWEIITGTAPATGRGFASVFDAAGENYAYNVAPVGNSWVLTVTAVPDSIK
jgi:hypothetical protein